MANKKITMLLGVCIGSSLLSGCNEFNPALEYEVDVYGPAPYIETIEDTSLEEFDPSNETIHMMYGPVESYK